MTKKAVPSLLPEARQCPSPNHDERPAGCCVDLLVIHNISLPPSQFGGPWIDNFFLNRLDPSAHDYFSAIHQQRVSAHLLIRRSGELVQYVPLHLRAWHAGKSAFQGREGCNDFSIGIELEGDDHTPYTSAQYHRLIHATKYILGAYPDITPSRITGHSTIATGRKTDPGPAFDWPRYLSGLGATIAN